MSDDYEIGYGRPPKHTRFKKGQSGNPKGRPKGQRNFKTDVMETLKAPVHLKESGRPRTVSTQKAGLLRLREKALSGDVRALDRLLELARTYNDEDLRDAAAETLAPSDQAIVEAFLERQNQHSGGQPRKRSVPRRRLLRKLTSDDDA